MLTKTSPRFKIGTLLTMNEPYGEVQMLITDHFPMAEEYETHPGSLLRREYNMYELYYLARGKTIVQSAQWLEEMVDEKKIEVASTPD